MGYLAIFMLVFLAVAGYSNAAYCVCNTALSDPVLQRNIDYACGNGADCSQINPNGACFNPNTVKDHCNYAVNNYYQKKGQVQGSCDFSGTASPTQTLPSGVNSACFSGNPSPTTPTPPGTGTGTPPGTGIATPPPGTGTPGTGTGTGTPGTGNGTGTGTPGTGTGTGTPGSGTGTGTGTGINVNPPFGMGPTTGFDNSGCMSIHKITNLFNLATLLVSGLIWSRLI
uniref:PLASMODESMATA CALLOSE-BINDING PROTEIN 4-like n=1 Tax=Erigeron canadensis TaxID=72917 RepID=UPI001CB9A07F|nr:PLASMODESMATA CALLOSE-BINDING PROTEIN 4-like [Erigeron canadensis]